MTARLFQLTHPRGRGATDETFHQATGLYKFQFTHPQGDATAIGRYVVEQIYLFQFTHPRGGGTTDNFDDIIALLVSIHAPTWGCDDICVIML